MKRMATVVLLASALASCTSQQAAQTQQKVSSETTQSFNAVNGVLKKIDAKDAASSASITG